MTGRARGLLCCLLLAPSLVAAEQSSIAMPAVGLLPAADEEITASLACGARRALARWGERTGGPLALEVGEPPAGWSSASEPAVRMVFEQRVVALIAPPDRATAHLLAQLGSRAHVPVVSTAEARSVTAAGSYWVVSVSTAGEDGAGTAPAFDADGDCPRNAWSRLGYDAAAAVAEAVSRAGLDRRAVVETWRRGLVVQGASGPFSFDRFGRTAPAIR